MIVNMKLATLICVFAPFIGSVIAGFGRNLIGKIGAHSITILGLMISLLAAIDVATLLSSQEGGALSFNLYTFVSGGVWFPYHFNIGFLVDPLTVLMMLVVTSISLLVHIYSIGYMDGDDGYQRFFSYISLFTFMMLMLVTSNNFLQLFFGWEGVGLVSYLLIGFWYTRESAIDGSLKAFLVNRVGDFGFILGIGLIMVYVGSLDYAALFNAKLALANQTISLGFTTVSLVTLICITLFIGAMGKSAQVPLHVWLPESMEGPTPISALIHAATMVTAGIFMVSRLSPLFEMSETARSMIIIIGATGALLMGLIGVVMNDIKRVVAYSTLSQLGYMMVALGASAYSVGIFHLLTHACFKALLFLAAGSVIIGMHHEQDMQKMGGLRAKMPVTFWTYLIGSLALCAFPPFAGFFSKDSIISAAHHAQVPGHQYAYYCVAFGALVTSFYTFRSLFLTFFGKFRGEHHTWEHMHESPWVVCLPLVILAIPSVIIGWVLYEPMLVAYPSLLAHSVIRSEHLHFSKTPIQAILEGILELPFYLSLFGAFLAWFFYVLRPDLPQLMLKRFTGIYYILINKFGFDAFNQLFWVKGSKKLGQILFQYGDQKIIDGFAVNGSAHVVAKMASAVRHLQSGYLFHYIAVMVLGLLGILFWFLLS
jgi:NADH-quinone oxidoreductase subunit L